MDLRLTFANGKMNGEGNDDVGRFLIKGRYDAASRECYWTKTYVGAHDVFYRGFREGKGIWGTWEINILGHGGFHIWPRLAGDGEADRESAAQVEPVDAIATEAATRPADAMKVEECARCVSNPAGTETRGTAALGRKSRIGLHLRLPARLELNNFYRSKPLVKVVYGKDC